MKSLQHVLWRGALALSLMAVGIGGGLGMPAADATAAPGTCKTEARALVADVAGERRDADRATPVVLRRPLTPAG